MAKSAAERRAARKRKAAGNRGPTGPSPIGAPSPDRLIGQLVVAGVTHALGPDADPRAFDEIVGEGKPRWVWLAASAMAAEARAADAAARAPEEWLAQLVAVGPASGQEAAVVSGWRRAEGLDAAGGWREALDLAALVGSLGVLELLAPPPSQWPQRADRRRRTTASPSADARMLSRIRALLAKAESTDFPEEAEALSAKAQDLMSRHAVDAAVLDAAQGTGVAERVRGRRVHVDNPYPEAKVQLLDAVAAANGVRVVWLERLGMATVVGLPIDLDLVDLLFTSLLVQATRAMSDAVRAGTRTRSPSFRRAFLLSFGIRIGQRLADVRDQVAKEASGSHGAALVPVMHERQQAVDDVFARMFPETVTRESRVVDAQGWHAGRLAAETADLGSGRGQVPG